MMPGGTARLCHPLRPDRREEMWAPFDLERLPVDDAEHGFLVMADPQILDAEDARRMQAESVPDIRDLARGLDPLAVEKQTGPDLPAKHGWVDPVNTDHLYVARPGRGAREVTVIATDPWGRSYRERLAL
ncbi:MAG: hypothetical protein GF330_13400 [Candidatus Eisenbacteria bacterium]|nr:hypothetical protein [Candidatus Eisenbacteria bacterium]